MSFSFNSQVSKRVDKSEYTIQIATDNFEQFLFMQDMAHECVDGKHKEKKGDSETFAEHYGCTPSIITIPDCLIEYIPECCKGCLNHPSNGGSGICNCALPYMTCSI